MAIVMTKIGQLPETIKYVGRCSSCMSEYEAERSDLKYESDYRESWYYASCALCKGVVYFDQKKGA